MGIDYLENTRPNRRLLKTYFLDGLMQFPWSTVTSVFHRLSTIGLVRANYVVPHDTGHARWRRLLYLGVWIMHR